MRVPTVMDLKQGYLWNALYMLEANQYNSSFIQQLGVYLLEIPLLMKTENLVARGN